MGVKKRKDDARRKKGEKWTKPTVADLFPEPDKGDTSSKSIYLACSCVCGTYVGGKTITGM